MQIPSVIEGFVIGVLIFAAMAMQSVYALDDISYAVGRYWGQDPSEEVEEKEVKPKTVKQKNKIVPPSAKEVLGHLTEMIDEAKAIAVLNPTMENVRHFMALKNKVGNMATRFSLVWQEVLLRHAELDYSAFKPTNNQGILLLNKKYQQRVERALTAASQDNGLLYFYHGHDELAQLQAPIIMRLAQKYQFDVLGVSLDGHYIESFERNTLDSGQARKIGVQKSPALFSMNPMTNQFLALSYTLLAERELEQRLFDVFSHFEAWQ